MKEEYTTLRQEILYWQNFRFLLLAASIALLSGILGLGFKNADSGDLWVLSSALLLLFLACAMGLSWYAGRGNAKIGAYLTVFFESAAEQHHGWEDRQESFLKHLDPRHRVLDRWRLSQWLGVIYFLLGSVVVVLPWFVGKQPWPPTESHWLHLGFPGAAFLTALILLCCFSSPRQTYIRCWEAVKKSEDDKNA